MTYTCSVLQVDASSHADIKRRIEAVNGNHDYDHMFFRDGGIDMTHIAIQVDPKTKNLGPVAEFRKRLEDLGHELDAATLASLLKLEHEIG